METPEQAEPRPSRRLLWLVAAGMVLAVVAVTAFTTLSHGGGQPTRKTAAVEYVKAVNDGDVGAMAKLLSPGGDARARKELAASPKPPLVISSIDVQQDFTDEASALVHVTAAGHPVEFYLSLSRAGGRWHVGASGAVRPDTSRP